MEENLFLFRRFRLLDQAGKQRVDQQFQEMELTAICTTARARSSTRRTSSSGST